MPKISARTLEQHRAETVERLIDAFGSLVMERGYDRVTLSDVASAVGLARTAIYNYYSDRESLLFAWTEREVHRSIENIRREVAAAGRSDEKLRVFVRLQLADFASRHLPPGREVIQFLKPETYGRFKQHIEPIEDILRAILEEGNASGEFAEVDPDSVIPLVIACIGSERGPLAAGTRDVEDATEQVASFVLRALQPTARAPAKAKPVRKRASG